MKTIGLLLAALVALSGQAPAPAPVRHLVYQFGFNTKAAKQGQGTGTLTVDIGATAADGGVMISGTDFWWNAARARATNTCEVYPSGGVSCSQRPYALSPIQLTLFPMLARNYFKGLSAGGKSGWKRTYAVTAAVSPGASGPAGNSTTWNCVYTFQDAGPIANAAGAILVEVNGTLDQQGGHYRSATSKQRIAYDPAAKIPVAVSDLRTHLPQTNVYNNDLVELKLLKDSQSSR